MQGSTGKGRSVYYSNNDCIVRFCITNLDVELDGEDGLEAGWKRAFWETMSFLLFESG